MLLRKSKWRLLVHAAAFLTATVALYALLGFLVLPYWIERKLPELSEQLDARVAVEDVTANPFLLTVSARGLDISHADGEPILNVPDISFDLGLSSVVKRAWVLQRIAVRNPRVTLVLGRDGQLNVLELLSTEDKTSDPAAPEIARERGRSVPSIVLESVLIEEARVEYVDRTRDKAPRLVLAPVTLQADSVSTLAGQSGSFRVDAGLPKGAALAAEGRLELQPLSSDGRVKLHHLQLSSMAGLAMTAGAIEPPAGRLDASFRYRLSQRDGEMAISLQELNATLADFSLRAAGRQAPMLAWSQLVVTGGTVDPIAHAVALASVELREGRVAASIGSNGRPNFALLAEAFRRPDDNEPSRDAVPWQVKIDALQVEAMEFLYADRSSGLPLQARIGSSALQLAAEVTFGGEHFGALVHNAAVSLRDIRLGEKGSGKTVLQLASADLEDGRADTAARSISASTLRFEGLTGSVVRDAAGRIGLPGMTAEQGAEETATRTAADAIQAPSSSGWQIEIERLAGNAHALRYHDQALALGVSVAVAKTSVGLALEIATGDAAQVRASGLDATMRELVVTPSQGNGKMSLGRLALEQASVDTAARRVAAPTILLGGGTLTIARTEEGAWQIAGITLPAADDVSPVPQAGPAAWQYDLRSVRVQDLDLALADRSYPAPIAYDVRLDASLENVHSGDPRPIRIEAAVQIAHGGSLRAEGTVGQKFATGSIRLNVDQLALTPLDPLLARYAFLEVTSGTASGDAQLRFGKAADPSRLALKGDVRLADLLVKETGKEKPFVSLQSLDASDMRLGIAPNRLDIAEVQIIGPEAELVVSEKRTLNLRRVLREKEAPGSEEQDAGDAQRGDPFPIRIDRITMRKGRLQFADLSLVLPFSTRVHELEGVIVGLSSAPDDRAELQLEGRIADYGSASAGGTLNAFDPTRFMDIGAKFDNVLIPPFSPYTATFAGRTIESGRLWLDLDYRIVHGDLYGENKIVVQDLELGERVEAPDAADWPLDLALALLEDSKGRISMEIPVSGEVGDPQFDYGQVIRNAINTTLRRIVSAPFRALASLFGGRDVEQVRTVLFNPGSDRIVPAEQQDLEQVAKALQARPELRLLVHGPYDPVQDARALRVIEVRRSISAALGRSATATGIPDPVAFTDPRTQRVLEELLRERLSEEDYRVFKRIIGPSDPEYYQAAFGELAARVEVPQSRLQRLAMDRARAIAEVVAANGVAPPRIAAAEIRSVNGQPSPAIAAILDLDTNPAG
jgi:uncharacterized protein involved in outer membrane biogenesis